LWDGSSIPTSPTLILALPECKAHTATKPFFADIAKVG